MTRLLCLAFALAGCATAGPRPPLQVPEPVAGALAEPQATASEATVAIVIRGDALQETVDRELPNPIHRESGGRLEAEAIRGDLRLEPGHGALVWTLPVELWARASLGPMRFSCGIDEARPHVDVTLRTELLIDDEWNLATETTPGPRQWSRRCRVSFLNIDVTSMIDPHIARAQERAARQIDEETARVDLRSALEQVWPLLFFPLELESGAAAEDRLRLLLRPEGLRVAELTGDQRALRLDVGVRGRFLVTSRFPTSPPAPLPPPGEVPAGPFLLHVEVVQPLAPMVDTLRSQLVGRTVTVDEGVVRVESVDLRVTPVGLAVGMSLAGALRGTLWALATPAHREGTLVLEGAAWTPETITAIEDEEIIHALDGLLGVVDASRWPIDASGIRERTLAALRGFQTPAGVGVEATLDPDTGTGEVFGSGDELVVRLPIGGSLVVSIDAATVAGGL